MPGVSRARWRIVALFVLSSLVLAACGGSKKKPSTKGPTGGETVTIGFVGALTGPNANLGINVRDGMRVAIQEENDTAKGPRIALKEFDTSGDPGHADSIKDSLIRDQSVVGIVGPVFSGETKALIPALHQAGLVMISPSATNKDLATVIPDTPVFHRVIADDGMQALGFTEYLVKERPRSVAYVDDGTDDSKGLTGEVERVATSRGIVKATTATLDPKSPDLSSTVNAIKTANPTTVFYGGHYAEAGKLKKQLTDAGVNASFISGGDSLDNGFVMAADLGAEGSRLACACNLALETVKDKKLKKFAGIFKLMMGREPGVYSPEGYDSAKLLIEGIKKAAAKERPTLLKYVEDLKSFKGISNPKIAFAPNGNLMAKMKFFVFQVKLGKIEPLQEVKVKAA